MRTAGDESFIALIIMLLVSFAIPSLDCAIYMCRDQADWLRFCSPHWDPEILPHLVAVSAAGYLLSLLNIKNGIQSL